MFRRVLIGTITTLIALTIIVSLIVWTLLSSWVPTQGKTLLIKELEQRTPLTASIGTMRYELLHGFTLERIRISDRASHELWASLPFASAQIDWLDLALRRRLTFHAHAPLEAPCQTLVTVDGRYQLRDHLLLLDLRTTDLPMRSIGTPLTRIIPSTLSDGIVHVTCHLRQLPHMTPLISVDVAGTHLRWALQTLHVTGDAHLTVSMTPSSTGQGPWMVEGRVEIAQGTLEGLSSMGTIQHLQGTAHFSQETLTIEQLTGTMFGSSWRAEGAVDHFSAPSMELHLTSSLALAPMIDAFPSMAHEWKPEGTALLDAVCRGTIHSVLPQTIDHPQPVLPFDCLARAELQHVTLTGSRLMHPLTEINGHLAYDALTRNLSVETLTAHVLDEEFHLDGRVTTTDPAALDIIVRGTLPLNLLTPWLPAHSPIKQIGGLSTIALHVGGTTQTPVPVGNVTVQQAALQLTRPALSIDHVNGSMHLTAEAIDVSQADMIVNGQPVSLQAHVLPQQGPQLNATATFAHGHVTVKSQVTARALLIQEGLLQLQNSHMKFRGAIGRIPEEPTTLELAGVVELSELTMIPFLSTDALKAWEVQGPIELNGVFQGPLEAWSQATIRGQLRAPRLFVRRIPLTDVTCTVEQRNGLLHIRIPSALIAGGKFQSEFTRDARLSPNHFFMQSDLVGLQLDQLGQAIPTWQARRVTGTASAHAVVSGPMTPRAAWQGQGWVNASGTHLGNLPLLDTVFRGLFGVLADRLGLENLRRAELTQASVQWILSQERFSTEDLRLGGVAGTEPIAIYAKGSVGMDQTLDVTIEPEFSEAMVLQAPTTSSLASTVLKAAGKLDRVRRLIGRHHLTGTLTAPRYRFEFDVQELFKQLAPSPVDLLQNLIDTVR